MLWLCLSRLRMMHLEKRRFKVLDPKKANTHLYYFQSWYSPIFLKSKTEEDSGNSVCITFEARKEGVKEDTKKREGKTFLLLANIFSPSTLDSHDVLLYAKNLYNDFTNNTFVKLPSTYEQKCIIVPAEHNAHNHFAMQLQFDRLPIQRCYLEDNGGDIEGLLNHAIKVLREDRFYLTHNAKTNNSLRVIDSDFLNRVSAFPNPEAYALLYAWAQGLVYADRFLYLFTEEKGKNEGKRFEHGYGVDR